MVSRSTAGARALGAFIFGALLYGPGNALLGHHDHGAASAAAESAWRAAVSGGAAL